MSQNPNARLPQRRTPKMRWVPVSSIQQPPAPSMQAPPPPKSQARPPAPNQPAPKANAQPLNPGAQLPKLKKSTQASAGGSSSSRGSGQTTRGTGQAYRDNRSVMGNNNAQPTRTGTRSPRSGGRGGSGSRPRSVQPRRDAFPYIMGAVIGAVVVGLMAVAYLLGSGGSKPSALSVPNPANPANPPSSGSNNAPTQPAASTGDPPRILLADFKALYDDPAKRPLIVDVRAKDAYDAGHIKGAESFPEADVDTRVNELPKDKLVVAYCQ